MNEFKKPVGKAFDAPTFVVADFSAISSERPKKSDIYEELAAAIQDENVEKFKKHLKNYADVENLFVLCNQAFNQINKIFFFDTKLKEILMACFVRLLSLAVRDDFLDLLNKLKPDHIKAILKLVDYEVRVQLGSLDENSYKNICASSRDYNVEELKAFDNLVGTAEKDVSYQCILAAYQGNIVKLKELMTTSGLSSIRGYTALHCAAALGRVSTVRYLLSAGVDLAARDYKGRIPRELSTDPETQELLYMAQQRYNFLYPEESNKRSVPDSKVIENFMRIPFSEKDVKAFIFYLLTEYRSHSSDEEFITKSMAQLMSNNFIYINDAWIDGKMILFFAKTAKQVEFFLSRGANPNMLNKLGQRPDEVACNKEVRTCILKAQQSIFEREYPNISAFLNQLVVGKRKFGCSVEVMHLVKSAKMIAFLKEQEGSGFESLRYLMELIDKMCGASASYKKDFDSELMLFNGIMLHQQLNDKDPVKVFVVNCSNRYVLSDKNVDPNFTVILFLLLHREHIYSKDQLKLFRWALNSQHLNALQVMNLLINSYNLDIKDLSEDEQKIVTQRLSVLENTISPRLSEAVKNTGSPLHSPRNSRNVESPQSHITLNSNNDVPNPTGPG